jgi:restriction system protein
MALPKYYELFTDVLEELSDGKPRARRDLFSAVIDKRKLTPEELAEKISSGYSKAQDRVHWSCACLTYAQALWRPSRGMLQITDFGRQLLSESPNGVTLARIQETPGFQEWKSKSAKQSKKGEATGDNKSTNHIVLDDVSPLEQVESAMEKLRADIADEVLSRMRTEHWEFMERAVLKVLLRLGYGTDEDDLFHVGGPYDGGIDGIINQDKLGLDQIYVQSKRYKAGSGISGNDINAFMGAMDIKGVTKGVFITDSHFTPQALKAAEQNTHKQVVLIDGEELANLMVQHKIGVSELKNYSVYKVDENFFEG